MSLFRKIAHSKLSVASTLLLATSLSVSTNVLAADEGRLAIEEIVVTGAKRDIAQQDLAIAVSTVTEKQLKNTFKNDVFSLGQLAPNVTLTPQNGFNAIAGGMRGTGFISILVTKDPSVGVVIDDFAFNHVQSQAVEMFDMEQVEIFRGPQGTLFGKNTTGGSINFTTKKPVLGETFANVEATYGQFDSNDGAIEKLNVAVNIPLGDKLAVRIAAISDRNDGPYTNSKVSGPVVALGGPINTNDPNLYQDANGNYFVQGNGNRIGGKDVTAVKVKLRYEPNDFYRADFTYESVDDNSDTPSTANETPNGEGYLFPILGFPGIGSNDPFVTGQSAWCFNFGCNDRGHDIKATGLYLTQTFNFDNFVLKSITGSRKQEEILASTYTGEAYTSLYDASRNSDREQFQQEFRLTSQLDGPFNFVTGVSYYEDDVTFQVFGGLGFVSLITPGFDIYNLAELQASRQDRESWAAYFDFNYMLTEELKLSMGVRHSEDEKDFHRLQYDAATGGFALITAAQYQGPFTNPLPESSYAVNIRNNADFEADTWRVVLDYKLDDNIMVYGSVATGYISGGFSETCGSEFTCRPYNDEENTNYEIGFKSDLMDGTLRLNGAIFETEYESLQRDSVVTRLVNGAPFQETSAVNEGTSTARGLELEATYLPTDNLRIDAMLGLLDHEYDSYAPGVDQGTLITGVADTVTINPDLSGLSVPFSPDMTWGLGVTYIQDLAKGGTLTYNLSAHHRDEFETSPLPANAAGTDANGNPIIKQKANTQAEKRTLLDAYVTWEASERMSLTFWGKNLTNEEYRQSANPVATLWNFTRFGDPRTIGVRASFNF